MTTNGLKCEACGSYSALKYPGLGPAVWEVHHRVPLSELESPTKTHVRDLAVLCPSCHRAIHRTIPMLSVEEFAKKFFSLDE
ncbi:HNH endonuclease [Hylemonella sp. W303a]|uniref:HNH endonuclease n=1 Tax=Hylemonella sp. W303a TaxID=3389873 RepID=UPI00396B2612